MQPRFQMMMLKLLTVQTSTTSNLLLGTKHTGIVGEVHYIINAVLTIKKKKTVSNFQSYFKCCIFWTYYTPNFKIHVDSLDTEVLSQDTDHQMVHLVHSLDAVKFKNQQTKYPNSSHQEHAPNMAFHSHCQSIITLYFPPTFFFEVFTKAIFLTESFLGFVSFHVHPSFPAANLACVYVFPDFVGTQIVCWFAKIYTVYFLYELCNSFNRIVLTFTLTTKQNLSKNIITDIFGQIG